LSDSAADPGPADHYKIVIQRDDETVKGYAHKSQWAPASDAGGTRRIDTIQLTLLDSGAVEEIPLDSAKAIFFVHDFIGQVRHTDLRFHDHLPATQCLWVRVEFDDGERIEGMIDNTHDFVIGSGFLMAPSDTFGNNWLIYVLKSRVSGFEVLGLRPKVKALSLLDS
jgi:hypothetical protein